MSKVGVRLKVDVSKIDKNRLFKGQKGTYLDATVFIDLDNLDQYGNSGMITQDITKQEKDAGQQGAILGNAQVFWKEGQQSQQAPQQQGGYQQAQANYAQQPSIEDQDIPF